MSKEQVEVYTQTTQTPIDSLSLQRIDEQTDETIDEVINEKNVEETVFDFSKPIRVLLQCINYYYKHKQNGTDVVDLIRRLIAIYNMTGSLKVKDYIKNIALYADIPFLMCLESARELCYACPDDECFEVLKNLCIEAHIDDNISTTEKIDSISILFRNKNCVDEATRQYINILQTDTLDCKYRYTMISSLKTVFDKWKNTCRLDSTKFDTEYGDSLYKKLSVEFYTLFLTNEANDVLYRILSGQWLLSNGIVNSQTQAAIKAIATNEFIEYNHRADAVDVLLRYGDEEYKQEAKTLIANLGNINGKAKTVYENAQNAHNQSIEESAMNIMKRLSTYPLLKNEKGDDINFDYVKAQIKGNTILRRVLERIEFDHALYTRLLISLKTALVMVYSYIFKYGHSSLYFPRLLEELESCNDICSTGIIERIANSITGCDDFSIQISFEEQISGNLMGRLNSRIKNLVNVNCLHSRLCDCKSISCYASKQGIHKTAIYRGCEECALCLGVDCAHKCDGGRCSWNEDLLDLVLEEMMIPSSKVGERKHFLYIYRLYISEIMEELRAEFIDYVDDVSFDLYFRKAMINYEN